MRAPGLDPKTLQQSLREERQSRYLYRRLAQVERGSSRERLFSALADAAETQARIWEGKLVESGAKPRPYRPDLRSRIVSGILPWLGPERMLTILAAMKVRGLSVYSHHEVPTRGALPERRHHFRSAGGNLRAMVFGVNDGLLSNASLMLGVAGGIERSSGHLQTVVIAGVAGLLAGAFSMASGEYVSVRSQRELYEYQIGLEWEELSEYPREEAMELALIYEAKGLTKEESRRLADQMIADPRKALDALSREELGLNPSELGSPVGAALSSFFSFSGGALVPVLPFLAQSSAGPADFLWALKGSVVLTLISLFGVGCVLSLFTGRSAWQGGLRMLAIGAGAGAVTYGIGSLLGVSAG